MTLRRPAACRPPLTPALKIDYEDFFCAASWLLHKPSQPRLLLAYRDRVAGRSMQVRQCRRCAAGTRRSGRSSREQPSPCTG